jgi:eukaryotic-like serine/threonine-protein kinase
VNDVERNPNRPEIGEFIGSKYRVTRVLSEGPLSLLFEAVNVRLGQRVAIKVPQPVVLEQPALVERFAREARAAVRLRSRNSVRVIDVDATGSGAPIMVMELLEGRSLSDELAERGALPVAEAVHYVLQTCSALVEAHSQGIVHRDLNPSRLFVAREPDGERCIKVLGLGISLSQSNSPRASAQNGAAVYTAPEVLLESKAVDPRSDVWSLGAILYEMLAGKPPFPNSTPAAVEAAILNELPEPLHALQADVPADVEAVVVKAMAKQPHHRFASSRELMVALTPFGNLASRVERPPAREPFGRVDASERTSMTSMALQAAPSAPAAPSRSRWRKLAVLAPLVITVSALYVTQCNRPRERQTAVERKAAGTTLAAKPVLTSPLPPTDPRDPPATAPEVGTPGPVDRGDVGNDTASDNAAAPAEGNGRGSNAPELPSAVREASSRLAEPRRAELTTLPHRVGLSHTRNARAPVDPAPARAASPIAKAPSSAKPAATPTVREWDEDSPVPP